MADSVSQSVLLKHLKNDDVGQLIDFLAANRANIAKLINKPISYEMAEKNDILLKHDTVEKSAIPLGGSISVLDAAVLSREAALQTDPKDIGVFDTLVSYGAKPTQQTFELIDVKGRAATEQLITSMRENSDPNTNIMGQVNAKRMAMYQELEETLKTEFPDVHKQYLDSSASRRHHQEEQDFLKAQTARLLCPHLKSRKPDRL
jgi:hypothetical protein